MIHRAILGSLERFIAIITENFAGKWPFWLNPKQVMVIPVAMKYAEYANSVAQKFKDAGLFAEVDESANTLNKMIRNAQVGQWSFVMGTSFFSSSFLSSLHLLPIIPSYTDSPLPVHIPSEQWSELTISRRTERDGRRSSQHPKQRRRSSRTRRDS
jgi:hypothetical protein